jgi:hypothetical protein
MRLWTGLTDRLISGLKAISNKLSLGLDRAIYKLDKFRRQLILRFYRALRVMEKLFKVIWEILRILVPILATFVPPLLGIVIALLVFSPLGQDSIIVLAFSTVLLITVLFAYFATDDGADTNYKVLQAQEKLIYISDLSEYSVEMKLFGTTILIGFFVGLWFFIPGLFVGIVLFILEFAVILLLPRIYKVPDGQGPESADASPASTPAGS